MTTERPTTRAESWERELIDQFAEFLKCSSIYPSNNVRVVSACDGFIAAVEMVKRVRGSRIVVNLEGDTFVVAGIKVEPESPPAVWMRDAFIRTALGGVELDAAVNRATLREFAERLRVNYGNPDKNYSVLWSGDFEGISPMELRYLGRHGEGGKAGDSEPVQLETARPKQDRVIGSLLQDDELMAKLKNLQNMLQENMPEGETAQVNLLEPIRQALPIEAVLDPKAACDLVDQILQICETKVKAMVAKEEFTDQESMAVTIAGIGRRYFKARVKDMGVIPQESLPEGRPEDASTLEDIELMLAEFEALPSWDDFELKIEGDVYTREALGVYLHEFVLAASADTLSRGFIREILEEEPRHSDLLQPYVDLCLSDAGRQEENRNVWRIVELLQESDPTGILEDRKFLTQKVVQFTFPRQFGAYLDTLSSSRPGELNGLADICRRVGFERINAAGDDLLENERIVTRRRLKKILAVDSDEMLPLVGVISRVNDNWVRNAVARFIRRRNPPVKESAALRVVRPLDWLSQQYLEALCIRQPDRKHRDWLQEESARLLRVFLRDTAGIGEMMERRIRAIHMLVTLPSEENIDLLKEVARERKFRFFRWKTRGLRKAARKARKQIKRQLASERK
jgi:hypothetical protein